MDSRTRPDTTASPVAPEKRPPWTRADWILLFAITLLGAVLRLYALGEVPPGFQFDEAYNAIDAVQVLEGNRPLFLPANGGREVLYTYFQAGLVALLGTGVYTFRLASALWGIAGVAATYVLFRRLLLRDSRLVATLGALALAISFWHIHFSHFGIRVITMPVIFSALFGTFWAATRAPTARRRLLLYLTAGLLAGLSVYANPTGRFVPIVLAAFVGVVIWRAPDLRRLRPTSPLGGLLWAGLAALIVFLPLGLTFYRNPEFFFAHASEVSIFAERVAGERGPLGVLAVNLLHVLGMFTFFGDVEWTHGIAGRPALDWVIGVPFYLGVVIWAMRLFGRNRRRDPDGDALWLLALWAIVMLAPSVLSDAAPNYSRTLPSLPAVLLPIGMGLAWLARLPWPRRWIGPALAALIVTASLGITVRDYFGRFPRYEQVYYAYDVDKLDALAMLVDEQAQKQVYFSPLWSDHPPVRLARTGTGIKTLDTSDTVVLPPDRGALFALTAEETARATNLANLWPGQSVKTVNDRYGRPLLRLVEVEAATAQEWPPGYAPEQPMQAAFDDAPTLLGMKAGESGALTLFWRGENPSWRSLTSFVHLIDADGRKVAQADKLPGNATYPTYTWSRGERVLERYHPELAEPCAAGSDVRVAVGWYEYEADGARRPRLGAPGDLVIAGTMTLPVLPLEEELTPPVVLESDMGDVSMLGYALPDNEALQGGSPFNVDLYMRANSTIHALPAAVIYLDDFGGHGLFADFTLAPSHAIKAGESFCQRVRLRVPLQIEVFGEIWDWETHSNLVTLRVGSQGMFWDGSYIGPLAIVPFSRQLALPAGAEPLADFGGELRLANAQVTLEEDNTLRADLLWQALTEPRWRSVAFVQVLSPDGQVVAQSDEPPGSRPTNGLVRDEIVADKRLLVLPADLTPGEYRVIVGLYDELSLERLAGAALDGSPLPDDAAEVAQFVFPLDGSAMLALR